MENNNFIPLWLNRTVKIAYYVNCFGVALTLIAYAAVEFGGMGIQFFLGCYQLGLAALATFAYRKWNILPIIKLLKMYWAFVLAWIVCVGILGLVIDSVGRMVVVIVIGILPMIIACYFVYVIYRIYSDFNETQP